MAGEDLDLKIIIDTLLNAKGFEDAQTGLKTLSDTTNQSVDITSKATDQEKALSKEIGGRRGAVADLTRVLLMNIGVTGAAGEVAKAAGVSMSALGGAISPVTVGATALVAVAALLIPKLIEWAKSTDDLEKSNNEFKDSLVSMLPELEEYIKQVPKATEELKALFKVTRDEALRKQKDEIAELDKAIAANEKEFARLTKTQEAYIENLGHGEVIVHKATEMSQENREAAAKLNGTIVEQKAKLNALMAAQEDGIPLQRQIADGIHHTTEKTTDLKISMEKYKEALQRWQFAEHSASIARDRQKRQEEDEANRIKKLITLYNFEAAAKRKAADDAADADADQQRAAEDLEKARRDAQRETALQGAALLKSMFGETKATRIAEAIADTYAGATRAYAEVPYPYNIAVSAMIVAQGLANVANIRKAQPGFDDPMSDMIAAKLGRKSAEDFVKLWGMGFHGGLVGSIGQPGPSAQTTNYHRNINVSMTGVVGSKTDLKRYLTRILIEGDRAERRSSISS